MDAREHAIKCDVAAEKMELSVAFLAQTVKEQTVQIVHYKIQTFKIFREINHFLVNKQFGRDAIFI